MTTLKPLGNRVLVKRSKAEVSKGGILLPETAQEKPKEGTVMAIGPGKADKQGTVQPLTVKVGDKVLFGSYAGTEVKLPQTSANEELLILSEEDILGIIG